MTKVGRSRWRPALKMGVVATFLPKTSGADTFGIYEIGVAGRRADNGLHTYCFDGLAAARQDNADNAMWYLGSATDMTEQFQSCAEGIDIRFQEGSGANYRGSSVCIDVYWADPNVCLESISAIYNDGIIATSTPETYENNLNKTIRHEIGHTVGLRHYVGTPEVGAHDCMIAGEVDGNGIWISYSQHHKDHINAAY